jgi:hypothetical protein
MNGNKKIKVKRRDMLRRSITGAPSRKPKACALGAGAYLIHQQPVQKDVQITYIGALRNHGEHQL